MAGIWTELLDVLFRLPGKCLEEDQQVSLPGIGNQFGVTSQIMNDNIQLSSWNYWISQYYSLIRECLLRLPLLQRPKDAAPRPGGFGCIDQLDFQARLCSQYHTIGQDEITRGNLDRVASLPSRWYSIWRKKKCGSPPLQCSLREV